MPTSNNDNPFPSAPPTSPTLTRLSSHGSHNVSSVHEHGQEDSDAAFARQLQAEEDAIATQYEYEQRQRQQQPPRRDENNRRHDNENTRHDDLFDGEHYGTDRNDSNNYNALSQAGSFTPPAEETNRSRGIPGEMYPEPEPSIEVLAYPVFNGTLPYAEFDDEQLARRLEREMRDEQIARNLQEREQERHHRNPPLREGSSSRNRAAGLTSGTVHYQSRPPRRCGRSAVCSAGIMAIIIGSAAVLVVLFGSSIWTRLGGDPNDLPPYFDQDWGKGDGSATGDFSQWRNNKKGLNLKIRNALSSDWDVFFVKAVSDWNAAPSLALTTEDVAEEPGCANVRGLMKVCNDFYGKTGWTGLNEVYFEGTMIAASVAKMNEDYLSASGTSTAEKQYVMCHEIGHGLGLPHRDEIPNNPDLGSCLDYTYRFDKNKEPDDLVDFENLTNLYGTINQRKTRTLRYSSHDEKYEMETVDKGHGVKDWHYTEGRMLHRSEHREVYENDLGEGKRVITTLILAKQSFDEDEQ